MALILLVKVQSRVFTAAYKGISEQLYYENDGLKIICSSVPKDVIAEGHALHHCVGSYVDRIADRECLILFLRRCPEPDKSFYTIEIRGKEIVQVRGAGNCCATPEVKGFIAA